MKSFDCFATSFRSFHFVSFVQVSASELKEELVGFFFKISTNENTGLTVTSRDFLLVPWQLVCYCIEQKV